MAQKRQNEKQDQITKAQSDSARIPLKRRENYLKHGICLCEIVTLLRLKTTIVPEYTYTTKQTYFKHRYERCQSGK